jgi:hypothetical protein
MLLIVMKITSVVLVRRNKQDMLPIGEGNSIGESDWDKGEIKLSRIT